MPIPALKVKSPQSWKKKRKYPTDELIAKRRRGAAKSRKLSFKGKKISDRSSNLGKSDKNKKTKRITVPKRSTYYGQREGGTFLKNKILKVLFKIGVTGFIAVLLFGVAVFLYYSAQVPSREEILASAAGSSTKIYDRTGKIVLYNLSGNLQKTQIPLDQIPEYVRWALISIEDDQFYVHGGFDLPALIKVGLHEVFGIGPQRGGSTITQQLVKNALLSPERTYRRKIKELVIAYQLEKKFSKDEILELYFNVVPYGSTAYGIEAAAEMYFGKPASELDLAEGAILAAMLQAVTYYSPYGSNVDALMARQKLVLSQMTKLGYISEAEAEVAKNEKLEFKKLRQSILAPHFSLYVKELLAEKYGEEIVEKGGLKVITTLDFNKQQIAEEAIARGVERNEKDYGAYNAALASIDARTGEVLAMVGSRDYFNEEFDGAVNVTMRPRQPGSSFKPIVYAAAFEKGLSPETILFDSLTKFKTDVGEDYEPRNYDNKTYGPVSIRKSLAGSLNIPAVKTIYLAGVSNVLDLAEKMGYTTFKDRSRFGLSLVLGGGEVKLIDHVRAFGVFAQEGRRHNLEYILKVEDGKGKILEEFKADKNKGEEVMNPQVARQINSILSDDNARAYVFGVGSYLTLGDRPVAAKTGTTNDYRDGWTIGYTPSLVTGVWVGNNDNSAMKGKAAGGNVAAPIWNEYMRRSLEGSEIEQFNEPEEKELPQKPMLNGEVAQEKIVQIDKASGKLATSFTPPSFIEEKSFQELHSILQYVNVNNILGPIPEKPEKDPQYERWEEGVKLWAEENEIEVSPDLPTEYDDVHSEANKPSLKVLSPAQGKYFSSPRLDVAVEVVSNSGRGISRVEYYLDSQLISTQTNWPYSLSNYQLLGFNNGERRLRVIAYDEADNNQEESVKIYLDLADKYSKSVLWLNPQENAEIVAEQFPLNLNIQINNYELYEKVDFYIKKNGASSVWVGYADVSGSTASTLLFEADPGEYSLYTVLSGKNGQAVTDGGINIRVVE